MSRVMDFKMTGRWVKKTPKHTVFSRACCFCSRHVHSDLLQLRGRTHQPSPLAWQQTALWKFCLGICPCACYAQASSNVRNSGNQTCKIHWVHILSSTFNLIRVTGWVSYSVQFKMVYMRSEKPICTLPCISSFPNATFETVLMFVWLTMAIFHIFYIRSNGQALCPCRKDWKQKQTINCNNNNKN